MKIECSEINQFYGSPFFYRGKDNILCKDNDYTQVTLFTSNTSAQLSKVSIDLAKNKYHTTEFYPLLDIVRADTQDIATPSLLYSSIKFWYLH